MSLIELCGISETEIIAVHHRSFSSHGMEWQLNSNGGHHRLQIGVTHGWIEEESFMIICFHIGLSNEEDVERLEVVHGLHGFVQNIVNVLINLDFATVELQHDISELSELDDSFWHRYFLIPKDLKLTD